MSSQGQGEAGKTEADTVCQRFHERGYFCDWFDLNAFDFGSQTKRARSFWLALNGAAADQALSGLLHRLLITFMLNECKPWGVDTFVIVDKDERTAIMDALRMEDLQCKEAASNESVPERPGNEMRSGKTHRCEIQV